MILGGLLMCRNWGKKTNEVVKNQFNTGLKLALLFCSLVHLLLLIFFFAQSVYLLGFYNLISFALYVFMTSTLKESRICTYMILAYVEVILLVIFTTLLLGWNAGFQFYIIALVPIAYFLFYLYSKNKVAPYILCFIAYIFFCLLLVRRYLSPNDQLIEFDASLIESLFFANIFIMITMISIVTTLFTKKIVISQSRLEELGYYDFLTKLLNRRKMIELLEDMKNSKFYLVLGDIDDFKHINDTFGHKAGDLVLQNVARIMLDHTDETDCVSRWGGEEFLILIKQDKYEKAISLADNIRASIEKMVIPYKQEMIRITMTFGVVSSSEAETIEELIMISDQRLYEGKEKGKNSVISVDNE